MTVYKGMRTIDGVIVTKDGEKISAPPEQGKYLAISDFEWGYNGDAPRLLAHVLLVEHLGNNQIDESLTEKFMRNVVSLFENEWELNSSDIDRAIENEQGATIQTNSNDSNSNQNK